MKFRLFVLVGSAICLLAIVAGAWVAPWLIENPGYVVIEIGGWRLRMSFIVLVGGIVGVWLAISLVVGLLRAPGRAVRRLRDARGRRNLDRGLLALSEGDWARAEQALARAVKGPRVGTAGYLAAARAAQGRGATERRDQYLALADPGFGQRHFAIGLVRARMLISEGETAASIKLLEQLHLKRPRHEGVLKLLLQGYQNCERWRDVRLLVPAIRKAGIVSAERAGELSSLAAARELEGASDVPGLTTLHDSLKRSLKQRPEVVAAFAARALELDRPELAEADLRRAIEASFDDRLLELYARTNSSDRSARIARCEQWVDKKPESAALHLALGRMYVDDRNDDKAREHLQVAVRKSSDPAAYAELAQVLDRGGQLDLATQCYRNAFRLERGRAPEPVPLIGREERPNG